MLIYLDKINKYKTKLKKYKNQIVCIVADKLQTTTNVHKQNQRMKRNCRKYDVNTFLNNSSRPEGTLHD